MIGRIAVVVGIVLLGACTRQVVESSVDVVSAIRVRDGALLVTTCRLDYKEETESDGEALIEGLLSGGHSSRDTTRTAEMGCWLSEAGELEHIVLTRYARASAVDGDCAAVRVYARKVQVAARGYFEAVFLGDAATARCLVRGESR